MRTWNPLAATLAILPIVIASGLIAHRIYQQATLAQAAGELTDNIYAVAGAVHRYHDNTGEWFPDAAVTHGSALYINPFDDNAEPYQGLDTRHLWRENNHGVVLQLKGFTANQALPAHTFATPFSPGEPYLRLLLEYSERGQIQSEILLRVQANLPPGVLAELDDHYYVIDLRSLNDG